MPNDGAGIKAGLEIHQQLDTNKLFCSCPSILSETVSGSVFRKLRVSRSEMGEIDRAAEWQSSMDRLFRYEVTDNSCLVELDEEPPHEVNSEAIFTGLEMAMLLHARPVDEVHFMRKIVVDGSNTTGFQRTALIATGGYVKVGEKHVRIQTICCEEDACRRMELKGDTVVYRLDRLGVPLLEIATEPDIDSPELLKETAKRIGQLLRATGRVKRGIGTIREDLNISIAGGARVEIKGVQELDMLPKIASMEAMRQKRLTDAAAELRKRGAKKHRQVWKDITNLFLSSNSSVIRNALSAGNVIGGALLPSFNGVLSSGGVSVVGTELAQRVRPLGVRGVMHSDELPAYGISSEEKASVARSLSAVAGDAFVIAAAPSGIMDRIFDEIFRRAGEAVEGVPEETRDAMQDGSTAYSRPLPGRARMYPETDVLPVVITEDFLKAVAEKLPEPFEVQAGRLSQAFSIHMQQAVQIAEEGLAPFFEAVCSAYGNASVLARILLNYIPEAERNTGKTFDDREAIEQIMQALAAGRFAKEGVPSVISCILGGKRASDCIAEASSSSGGVDAAKIIAGIIESHMEMVRERGEASLGPLMGLAMKELRGRMDGKDISSLLLSEIRNALAGRGP
ncbi:MAG: Glu-tRNA(Gln) amidotransferase subunit GatE [Thermoplasmata archaeon]|nr:Glu-tRNA(Gln) amidotransferase subunit GatE [Candidatus Sysuiplasma acidicola]